MAYGFGKTVDWIKPGSFLGIILLVSWVVISIFTTIQIAHRFGP